MIATRTIASNCLQFLGARIFAVSILTHVYRRMGRIVLNRFAADPFGGGSAAERR
jgi:hypothetical protein